MGILWAMGSQSETIALGFSCGHMHEHHGCSEDIEVATKNVTYAGNVRPGFVTGKEERANISS